MSGSIPNIVIILLAVGTYGSLAFLIMRFALRESRGAALGSARIKSRARVEHAPIPTPVPSLRVGPR
jgi:hypothetical protein